jgi:hypothetical protein
MALDGSARGYTRTRQMFYVAQENHRGRRRRTHGTRLQQSTAGVGDGSSSRDAWQSPPARFPPYIPSAVEIGPRFGLTGRVARVSPGRYEPLVRGLRESGATAAVMAGDRT